MTQKKTARVALLVVCAALGAPLLFARRASAEHFDILLKITSGDKQAEASMDTTPPIGGVNPRPVLKLKAGERMQVTWRMKNSSPHGTQKNATLHFFVVHEAQTGQKPVPDPAGQAGVMETQVTTDLAPGAVATGALKLKIAEAGSYLIRIQSEGTHEEHGHEHFAAIDVEVQ